MTFALLAEALHDRAVNFLHFEPFLRDYPATPGVKGPGAGPGVTPGPAGMGAACGGAAGCGFGTVDGTGGPVVPVVFAKSARALSANATIRSISESRAKSVSVLRMLYAAFSNRA
jgi:hypothetical protein